VYVCYQYSSGGAFLERSTTGGGGLQGASSGISGSDPCNFYAPYVMDPSNSNRLLLGTNRIYETTNQGGHWAPISTPMANGWTVRDVVDSVAAAAGDPNTVYATTAGHVWVTRDHGAHWMESDPVTPNAGIRYRDIKVDQNNPSIAYVVAASFSDVTGGGHVWMTSDGGQSWTDITGNLPDEPVWGIALEPAAGPYALYVGAEDAVYGTYDDVNWFAVGVGLPRAQVRQIEINDNLGILAAGTYGRGLWELSLNQGMHPRPPARNAGSEGASLAAEIGFVPGEEALRQQTIWNGLDSLSDHSAGTMPQQSETGSQNGAVSSTALDEAVLSFHRTRQDSSRADGGWVDGFQEEWGELV
jgi:hypothetical protein